MSLSISTPSTPAAPLAAMTDAARASSLERATCPRRVLLGLLDRHAQHHPLNQALVILRHGRWQGLTYLELARRVRHLAAWLDDRFPQGHGRVAVLAESGPAWGVAALAILASGNALVPLDTSAEPGELSALLRAARPDLLFASATYRHKVAPLLTVELPDIDKILDTQHLRSLDTHDPTRPADDPAGAGELMGVQESGDGMVGVQESGDGMVGVQESGAAVMAFTSGTTGAPKGVEIGFGSLMFQVEALTRAFALRASDRLLSLLPLHHMLELTAGFLCPLWRGAQINYLGSLAPGDAVRETRARGITRIVTVPAWLALLKRELEHHSRSGVSDSTTNIECEHSPRARARAAIGVDFEHFVCGGAPLAGDVAAYFEALGAPVLQGYGLTETSPVVATNTAVRSRRGSVGVPLPGTEMRIEANGEILVRGPHVASRYRLDDGSGEAVADDEGWFHTGDLGHLDDDGFLYVTGRAKSTIVLPSGKNVQPEEIEACLQARPELADAGVVGLASAPPGRGESVCAVVVPSREYGDARPPAGDDLERALRALVAEATAGLARFKRPKDVVISHAPLPRTATGKLRRAELARRVARGKEHAA